MKRTMIAALLMASAGAANAGLSFQQMSTATRTEAFNGVAGLANYGVGTSISLGTLVTDEAGYIAFTYLGQESGYNNAFHLNLNGTHLYESNPVSTTIGSLVFTTGAINFSFEGNTGRFANNGGSWASGTSIGLIGTNMTVTSGAAAGNYAFILGYNDSAGAATLGDWDDFVVGVNFVAAPIPEPETYAMMLAGLGLLGIAARRRKQKEEKAAA